MPRFLLLLLSLTYGASSFAFCGFFVAKAESKLFNESSQVIMVRDGKRTTISMSNDFRGEVKDFAMVVPVPTVLAESDIRVIEQELFTQLDNYSAPRLAEYYDRNPCPQKRRRRRWKSYGAYRCDAYGGGGSSGRADVYVPEESPRYKGVKVEAEYAVGEYDILILSASESGGLKNWLTDHEYTIPEEAHEVLDPYIKSKMKFFLARVNIERQSASEFTNLKPLQISFESEKFMLPIRLGMANASKAQDLVIYAFTRKGRVETTNYRTVPVHHDINVPEFVEDEFGEFYQKSFNKQYEGESRNAVFLEYAWNLSAYTRVKCDPCVSPPPPVLAMDKLGVSWFNETAATVFFTRLHVRYDRENFPQDLQFQVTPNQTHFQGRYVIHHPVSVDFNCENGDLYLEKLITRRQSELAEYQRLTDNDISEYTSYVSVYEEKLNRRMEEESGNNTNLDFETGALPESSNHGSEFGTQQANLLSAGNREENLRFWLYVLIATAGVLLYMEVLRRLPLRKNK